MNCHFSCFWNIHFTLYTPITQLAHWGKFEFDGNFGVSQTVVHSEIKSVSSKWELSFLLPSSLELWRKERASKAALILMKNSQFDRTLRYSMTKFIWIEWTVQIVNMENLRLAFMQESIMWSNGSIMWPTIAAERPATHPKKNHVINACLQISAWKVLGIRRAHGGYVKDRPWRIQ